MYAQAFVEHNSLTFGGVFQSSIQCLDKVFSKSMKRNKANARKRHVSVVTSMINLGEIMANVIVQKAVQTRSWAARNWDVIVAAITGTSAAFIIGNVGVVGMGTGIAAPAIAVGVTVAAAIYGVISFFKLLFK